MVEYRYGTVGMGGKEMAKELGISEARVKKAVSVCEKKGWVFQGTHKKWFLQPYYMDEILDECLKAMKKAKKRRGK